MSKQNYFQFYSIAKVNLYLYIQEKRQDNYHNLELDFVPISLMDKISLSCSKGYMSLVCHNHNLELPRQQEDNLIIKAIRCLEKITNKKLPLQITIDKKIPIKGGLGGASGNAASTLVVCNKLFNLELTKQELFSIASSLGADVPFFLDPKPALATNTGNHFKKLCLEKTLFFVILFPKQGISTRQAFANVKPRKKQLSPSLYTSRSLQNKPCNSNDFWEYALSSLPNLEEGAHLLLQNKAYTVGLSGSGSCLYGLFHSYLEAKTAWITIDKKTDWASYTCQSLSSFSYI